jgi:hypothetical protein
LTLQFIRQLQRTIMKFIIISLLSFVLFSCSSLLPRRVYDECKARLNVDKNSNPTYAEYYDGVIAKSKPPIKELKYFVARQDSAGLVNAGGMFINNSDKTIKYLWLSFDHYNRVGDKVRGNIHQQTNFTVKLTGPVMPGGTGDQLYVDTYYIRDILCVVPTKVKIEYMDGSKTSISGSILKDIIYKDYPNNVNNYELYTPSYSVDSRGFPANCPWIYSKKEKEIFDNHPEPVEYEQYYHGYDMSYCPQIIERYEKEQNK